MNYKEELYEYKSGLRLVFIKTPGFYTSKIKISFACGAEDESAPRGIAHLIEHCVFNGTTSLSQEQISEKFNSLSADPDASTSSEFTSYKASFPRPNLEKVLSLYADVIFNSTFNQKEVDKEKLVIIEEIKMRSDMPETLVFDNLTKNMYAGLGLGNDIGGEIDLLKQIKSEDMHEFRKDHYCAKNTFVVVVGDYDKQEVINLVDNHINSKLSTSGVIKKWSRELELKGKVIKEIKPTAQTNILLAYKSLPYESMDRNKLAIISYILGGSMSSRLFTKIRNELSLCYSVYTFDMAYKNNGFMGISVATSPENATKALTAIKEEVNKILINGVTDEEFNSAKEMSINKYLMGRDYPRASLLYLAYTGKLVSHKELEQNLKNLTKKECEDMFRKCIKPEDVIISYVGKKLKV